MDQNKDKAANKKTTVNLFIDSQVLSELKGNAKSKNLSLNANINRILMQYVSFYRRVEDLQGVHITGNDFRFFLDNISEDKMLDKFMENLTDLIPSSLNERNIPTTLQNLIKYEFSHMVINAGIVKKFTTFRNENGLFCLMFQHNHGLKWSRILAKGFTQQLQSVIQLHATYKITPTTVIITFQDKNVIREEEIEPIVEQTF
jgi:hypothetical protein